jgi:(E)-4-hydroxy-3-methylbut-2-enyl-diphosphate synthase
MKSRVINVGNLPLGGGNPIRIQSMTSTDTMDTVATIDQCLRLIEAGCEMIRISAPSVKAAQNLAQIKKELSELDHQTPLIADIHFNPKAAEIAAKIVEKIRINPGNFIDKNSFAIGSSDSEELDRIKLALKPLLQICRENKTVVRIGVNLGSLSDRILYKFGNTALGMVESAMEYLHLCRQLDFHDVVLSLKSSNILSTITAHRLLVDRMQAEGMDYPLHLGVTEAGNAEDGRIKSAAGIGTLLKEGIGDTIRVSLTEDPVSEIPVAKEIVAYANKNSKPEFSFFYIKKPTGFKHPLVIANGPNTKADLYFQNPDLLDKNGGRISLEPALENPLPNGKIRILKSSYKNISREEFWVHSAMDFAQVLLAGHCDGIWLSTDKIIGVGQAVQTAFDILQVTQKRISKTEFIACPSCGRTLYNIEKALAGVKEKTAHLKGLKIAVMGCIVNGPGEMADADYGYIGSGRGKVCLYKGKQQVKKNIDETDAVNELIKLIKENGDWVEQA